MTEVEHEETFPKKSDGFQFKLTGARVDKREHTCTQVALNVRTYMKVARHGHVHPAICSADREINYNKFNGKENARREGVAYLCMYTCTTRYRSARIVP